VSDSTEGRGGNIKIVIKLGANDWNGALSAAARHNNMILVDLFISKGASNWDWALAAAARGGHAKLVGYFISKGANDWNSVLSSASRGGHKDLVDFFVSKNEVTRRGQDGRPVERSGPRGVLTTGTGQWQTR